MALQTAEELAGMFDPATFGAAAVFRGAPVNVIFDQAEVEGAGSAQRKAVITAPAIDFLNAATGDAITIAGVAYTLARPPIAQSDPDIAIIELERV